MQFENENDNDYRKCDYPIFIIYVNVYLGNVLHTHCYAKGCNYRPNNH
jgi:hypothetical protein